MPFGLLEAINFIEQFYNPATNSLSIPNRFFTPGFWVILAIFARRKGIRPENLDLPSQTKNYASAMGLAHALWDTDDYQHNRQAQGINYSSLEHLNCSEATDTATSKINSCIRNFVGGELPNEFVGLLCEVVGDLHDNVWAHGKASGFSIAQKWNVPYTLRRDHYLEFALADSGIGFQRELRRVGMNIDSDQKAIEWCIQEGNSTKKFPPEADWAQSMPSDMIGNPLKGIEKIKISDNHHLGLGLYKLICLIQGFRGVLWLGTGSAILKVEKNGKKIYSEHKSPWQGVAIACRFQSSKIASASKDLETGNDKDIEQIMHILGGHHD